MSNKTKIKLNDKGIKELLASTEVENEVESVGKRVAGILTLSSMLSCGKGYEVDVKHKRYCGAVRPVAEVKAVNNDSINDNLKNNTLLKAVSNKL